MEYVLTKSLNLSFEFSLELKFIVSTSGLRLCPKMMINILFVFIMLFGFHTGHATVDSKIEKTKTLQECAQINNTVNINFIQVQDSKFNFVTNYDSSWGFNNLICLLLKPLFCFT